MPNILRKIIAIFGLVFYLNIFFFHNTGPVAFTFVSLGLCLFLYFVFLPKQNRLWSIFSLLVLLSNFILITHTSVFTTIISVLFTLAQFFLLTYLLSSGIPYIRSLLELVIMPLRLGLNYLRSGIHAVSAIFTSDSQIWNLFTTPKLKKTKAAIPWILGIIIGIPVTILLISLLSNADPIFASYVRQLTHWLSNLFRGDFWSRLFARSILSLVLLGLLSPFVYLAGKKTFNSPLLFLSRYPLISVMTVIVFLVTITLGLFLIIQAPYIFVRVPYETDLSKFGVATYSEYVNRGFGELLKVSFFIYGLIWLGLIALRNKTKEQKAILPYLQVLVIAEFVVFLVSIGRRVMLYQNYHGWSLGRIYGGFLLVWIFGITITLTLRHFIKMRWVLVESIFTALLVLFAGFFNSESFITNTHPPTVNKKVDYVYLSRFSADGYEGWLKSYRYAQKVLLDDNLDKLSFYDGEKRREIAYAGLITHMLTRNYDFLIYEYGSEEELRNYYKVILLSLRQDLKSVLYYLDPHPVGSEVEMRGEVQITVYPASPPLPPDSFYTLENVKGGEKEINKNLEILDDKNKSVFDITGVYFIDSWPDIIKYDPSEQFLRFYSTPYSLNNSGPIGPAKLSKTKLIDQIFMWNLSKQTAYKNIKTEIPYPEILRLQANFMKLYQRISKQNSDDRQYSSDISFDTPFLEPL